MACPHWGSEVQPAKLGYGLTYGFAEDNHIIGFNLLMAKPFFTTSNFPFSIQGTVTILTTLSKYGNNKYVISPDKDQDMCRLFLQIAGLPGSRRFLFG